jgi:hypothetical protein
VDLQALVNTKRTHRILDGDGEFVSRLPERIQFENRMGFENASMPGNWISIRIMLVSK